MTEKKVVNSLWKAFNITRGSINMLEARKYIYNLFYLKSISDNIIKNMNFKVSKKNTFNYIMDKKDELNLGKTINNTMKSLEKENSLLKNSFIEVDFDNESLSSEILSELVITMHELDLNDVSLGDIFESLLKMENQALGKRLGDYFTPIEVSGLLTKLMEPKKGENIHDPTAGTGTLLAKLGQEIEDEGYSLYAQDINKSMSSICKMNLILHGMGKNIERIESGNIFSDPKLLDGDQLKEFDIVVSVPPFSVSSWWDKEKAKNDKFNRFKFGIPPQNSGDYAFLSHVINVLKDKGRAAFIGTHGILFRSRSEKTIRKNLIEKNLIDAVIGLPENIFYNTAIPSVVLILKKNRKNNNILFIDASKEYKEERGRNRLSEDNINKIYQTYKGYKTIDKFSYIADKDEIKKYDYNLNISLYVDTFEKESKVNREEVNQKIEENEKEFLEVKEELDKNLEELKNIFKNNV